MKKTEESVRVIVTSPDGQFAIETMPMSKARPLIVGRAAQALLKVAEAIGFAPEDDVVLETAIVALVTILTAIKNLRPDLYKSACERCAHGVGMLNMIARDHASEGSDLAN